METSNEGRVLQRFVVPVNNRISTQRTAMSEVEIVNIDSSNVCDHGFCGYKSPKQEGYTPALHKIGLAGLGRRLKGGENLQQAVLDRLTAADRQGECPLWSGEPAGALQYRAA